MGPLARVSTGVLGISLAGLIALAPPEAGGNGGGPAAGGIADLPYAQGQVFDTLDAYLAHLQTLGTLGITWYRALPDGRYEAVRRRAPGTPPTIFTRQELLDRYGFAQ
ncbi:hypothetical protein [Roseicyclus sp.]|uniref:hypothetical protein n=1 Tax=Roseicyclus sp. TaxID=1914329 RepID=UPI003F6A841A